SPIASPSVFVTFTLPIRPASARCRMRKAILPAMRPPRVPYSTPKAFSESVATRRSIMVQDRQGAHEPKHEDHDEHQADSTAEAAAAIGAIAVIAASREQENQKDDNEDHTHGAPILTLAEHWQLGVPPNS